MVIHVFFHGRYESQDTIDFICWRSNGTFVYTITEDNSYWDWLYYARHSPYPNIPTNEKIHSLRFPWTGNDQDRIWAK